ncbi:MAG TPA: hypothetical protein DIW17_07670 [Clostridiales bacterium]|jgi:hypothetical protein|uniref:PglZ domain-containing protein n=1 Tax=Syntrophomonas wolfei TaxID=863 RepID=UPI000EE733F7|nr:PglZ domain-containing protein [Syntrophomonas wolfei]HCS73737.1 hypothetical protein [Clostridiales bacterium]
MIQIIIDLDDCYDGEYDVYCYDAASYVQSRLLLDEVKDGKRGSVLLLIAPHIANYFVDLRSVPAWTKWESYSYQRLIEECAADMSLGAGKLQELESIMGSKAMVIKFLRACKKDKDIEWNILNHLFYEGERLKDIKTETELWDWFETATLNERTDWINRPVYELLYQTVEDIKRPFWDLLLAIKDKNDLDFARKNVMATYLFNEYPLSSKSILHQRIAFRDSLFFDPAFAESMLEKHRLLAEEINYTVFSCRDSLSIFESNDLEIFLRRTKGYLDEEWFWVWNHLNEHFSESSIENEISRLLAWSRVNRPELLLLQKLFALKIVIDQDYSQNSWEEWANFYTGTYLQWFPSLERGRNIIEGLKGIESFNDILKEIINRILLFKEKKERQYQEFLLYSFPELLRNRATNQRLLKELATYMESEKVFFLVIDGLRWEIWEVVREILEDNGYFLENDNQYCLSMLPSITSVSRIALLSGKSYDALLKEKRAGLFKHGVFDESQQLQRFFATRKVAFKIGGLDDLSELIQQDADFYTFIYSQADHILHGAGDINRNALKAMMEEFIQELLKRLESKPGMLLAISTDHGSIKVSSKQQISLPLAEGFTAEAHGNSVYLWQENEWTGLSGVEANIDSEKWYILRGDKMEEYGLPLWDKNERKSVAWLFPRNQYYVGRKSGNYTHGGLSMQETIIPYGIFRKQNLIYQQLWIEIGSYHMIVEENSYMEIIVFNPNPFGIKKVEMNLAATGFKEIIRDLGPRTRKKLRCSFVTAGYCCKSGCFNDEIQIQVDYLNDSSQQIYLVEIPIVVPVEKKTIKDDVAAKRSLDF